MAELTDDKFKVLAGLGRQGRGRQKEEHEK